MPLATPLSFSVGKGKGCNSSRVESDPTRHDDDDDESNSTSSSKCDAVNAAAESAWILSRETQHRLLLRLTVHLGMLAVLALQSPLPRMGPVSGDSPASSTTCALASASRASSVLVPLLQQVQALANAMHIDLVKAIRNKMELNARKYPVALCKVRVGCDAMRFVRVECRIAIVPSLTSVCLSGCLSAYQPSRTRTQGKEGKYTQYSHTTGITKDQGQCTVQHLVTATLPDAPIPRQDRQVLLELRAIGGDDDEDDETTIQIIHTQVLVELTHEIRRFATEREWMRYHTPRNLILACAGEVAELAELLLLDYQHDEHDSEETGGTVNNNTDNDPINDWLVRKDKLSQELADVSIYLLRIADVCAMDWTAVTVTDLSRTRSIDIPDSSSLVSDVLGRTTGGGSCTLQSIRDHVFALLAVLGQVSHYTLHSDKEHCGTDKVDDSDSSISRTPFLPSPLRDVLTELVDHHLMPCCVNENLVERNVCDQNELHEETPYRLSSFSTQSSMPSTWAKWEQVLELWYRVGTVCEVLQWAGDAAMISSTGSVGTATTTTSTTTTPPISNGSSWHDYDKLRKALIPLSRIIATNL